MRNLNNIKTLITGSVFGALVLVGAALGVNAQNPVEEQREWQRAQVRAQREEQECLRTRSPRECRQAANAARRAEQERMEYQQTLRSSYNRRDSGFGRNQFRVGNYTVDQRGAELLRTAVRNGYSQGYRQGQMDRQYRRGFNYGDDSLYRSGTYGYQSYVARTQYQNYFQQGYQRGYEDGYNSTSRYGTRSGSGFNILGNVLNTILNIRDY
jgi:flagellar biosynthesis/type III secretory pathway protein FliH